MKIAIAALILITSAGAQPMRIKPFTENPAISVVPDSSHLFGIEVFNQTDEPIQAVSLRWDYTRADTGSPDAEVAARYPAIGNILNAGTKQTFWPHQVDQHLKPGTEVTVALDAVLFASGRVVGPNRFGIDKHLELKYASIRYVAAGLIAREDKLRLPWLQSLTAARAAGDPSFGGGAFWRTQFITGAAMEYLALRNIGRDAVLSRAKANLERSEQHLRREIRSGR